MMKKSHVMISTVFALSASLTGYAIAHGSANANADASEGNYRYENGMMGGGMMGSGMMGSGMMGSGMMSYSGMGFNQPMFDLDQLSAELNLTDAQISILSQLEATHVQMQTIMQAAWAENDEGFGHMQMMTLMTENADLMTTHFQYYADFEKSLSKEQAALWRQQVQDCH
jgi:hypothetical protein